jgi:uncharacterized protein (TIGR03435 family)
MTGNDSIRFMADEPNFRRTVLVVAAVTILTVFQVRGQSQKDAPAPTIPLVFEVASIKPLALPLPSGGGPWIANHGRFRAEVGYPRDVIGWAYDLLGAQVKGGPDWIDREPYYFEARAENPEAGRAQIKSMLQTLLRVRFNLAVHRDTQEAQVYTLIVGKNGSKLQDAKEGQKNYINWAGPGQVTFAEVQTLRGLINILSFLLSAPVVDGTGLNGSYNFSLDFTNPQDPRPRQVDSPPDLFAALQEQLGLKLEAKKAPVPILVIDRIDRPSEN